MGVAKRVLASLAALAAVVCPRSSSAYAVPVERPLVVAYHQFVQYEAGLEPNMPVMLISQFEDQLRYLKEHGIRTLSIEEYAEAVSSPMPPGSTVLLTIDDGYESVYTLVYPLLRKYDMHATAFVITSRVGKQNVTNPHQPWLSWDECKEMDASGLVDIEAHADASHDKVHSVRNGRDVAGPYLTTRTVDPVTGTEETDAAYRARVLDELSTAKRKIDTQLDKDTIAFCWPFGASTTETLIAAREAGYRVTFRLAGEGHIDGDRLRLHSPENWGEITRLLGGAGLQSDPADVVAAPTGYGTTTTSGPPGGPSATALSAPGAQYSPWLQELVRRLVLASIAMLVGGLFWSICALVLFRNPRPARPRAGAPTPGEGQEGPSGLGA